MKTGHEMFHHPGSSRSFPKKEHTHARHPTIHHRAHLATALGIVATNPLTLSDRDLVESHTSVLSAISNYYRHEQRKTLG